MIWTAKGGGRDMDVRWVCPVVLRCDTRDLARALYARLDDIEPNNAPHEWIFTRRVDDPNAYGVLIAVPTSPPTVPATRSFIKRALLL